MNVFLTFDYELFFGSNSGSVEKCLLEPTRKLLALSKKYDVKMTYFVDAGYLYTLEKLQEKHPRLQEEYRAVTEQLDEIIVTGNDIQLHIHPHWEHASYDEGKWHFLIQNNYKLSDFSIEGANDIVRKYKKTLDNIIGRKTHTFRAGGWCLQPFSHLKPIFEELGIRCDSSVFPNGKLVAGNYAFDYTKAPVNKGNWSFSIDECQPDPSGQFMEYPIASIRYNPLFYWRLFAWGRLLPARHKFIGDGNYIAQPGLRKRHLTRFSWNHVSSDGFFASKLKSVTQFFLRQNRSDLVVIAHPKSQTHYSLEKTEAYLKWASNKVCFQTFHDLLG